MQDPRLTDGKVLVRPCCTEDAESIFTAVRESINELSQWAPWCPHNYSLSLCQSWLRSRAEAWARGEEFDFVVEDAVNGRFLGGCGLYDINHTHNFANLGYWVRTNQASRGVATAAARLVARFGFAELGFTRLEIVAAVGNVASQRVAAKMGAVREGIERNRHIVNGRMLDAVMFSLIPIDISSTS